MKKKLAGIAILIIVLIGFVRKYDLFSMDNSEPKEERTKRHISRKAQQKAKWLQQLPVRESLKRPCDKLGTSFINFMYSQVSFHKELIDTVEIRSFNFSPDSNHIVTATTNGAKVWNVQTGMLEHALHTDSDIRNARFSHDGSKIATASSDNTVKIWNAQTGELQHSLAQTGFDWKHISFNPKDSQIAIASEDKNMAQIWDIQTGDLKYQLPHEGIVYNAIFSDDGNKIATSSVDGSIKIWDAQTGTLEHSLVHHLTTDDAGGIFPAAVQEIIFTPSGDKIISQTEDYKVTVWDVNTGLKLYSWGIQSPIQEFLFNPKNEKIIIFSRSDVTQKGNAIGLDLKTGQKIMYSNIPFLEYGSHQGALSSDGHLLATSGSFKDAIAIWNLVTDKPLYFFEQNNSSTFIGQIKFSPNNIYLAADIPITTAQEEIAPGVFDNTMIGSIKIWNLNSIPIVDNFLNNVTMDQCDLLQAFQNTFKKDPQTGKPIGRIQATQEQWRIFKTMPQAIQDALKLRIKKPEQQASKEWTIWNLIKKAPEDNSQN